MPSGLTLAVGSVRKACLSAGEFPMPSILVVEPEPRYSERIHAALGADGWSIRLLGQSETALEAATTERPALILISSEAPGAESIINLFSRRAGGPGVVGLLPESEGPFTEIGADDHLNKPFTDQELRLVVRRNMSKGTGPESSASSTASSHASSQVM